MHFIGIDLGTTSVRALLMSEDGKVVRTVSRDYPIEMDGRGWSQQNPDDWWDGTAAALRELTSGADAGDIGAVSFSGQMHGLVLLDERDRVIRPAILWNDQRTQAQCDYLNNAVGRTKLLESVANVALTGFTAPKILWVKENEPENFKKISKIMLPKDYIAYKLSGVFATDFSDASGMLLLDVKNGKWSDFMLGVAGVDKNQLAPLYRSYEAVGAVTPEAAALTGLSPRTLVVAGGGDQAVGAVGVGAVLDNTCSISLGTSGVFFVASDNFNVDKNPSALHSFRHANGKFHMMGVTLAAAASNKWWVEDILKASDYGAEQAGVRGLGKNQVFFLPYLSGERTPYNDPSARGAFVGMNLLTTRADMTLAVMEGVAYSLRDTLEAVKRLGVSPKSGRLIGGGAKSPLWSQIIADVLDMRIEKIASTEGPAYGAALLAAVGWSSAGRIARPSGQSGGAFASVEEACALCVEVTDVYEPDADTAARYTEKYRIYAGLYGELKETFAEIAK
ncbi:MAG: xylulokinase [Firmicutes bacterium]|nr:xylulokinase [Bacillota bacterium]